MERTFDRALLAGIGVIVGLLILNALLAYRNTRQLDEDAASVVHTHQVIDSIGKILLDLVDAETGQRGYLLTGREEFLEPYQAALGSLERDLSTLRDLTKDNASQQARLATLERSTANCQATLKRGIDLRRANGVTAQVLTLATAQKQQMDALRDLVSRMERDEQQLLAAREQQAHRAYGVAVTTGALAAALAIAVVGLFVWFLQRSLAARHQATVAIHEQREWFRTTLASIGDAVITTDTAGRVTLLNPTASQLIGWTQEQAKGQSLSTVFHIVNEQTRQPAEDPVRQCLRKGTTAGLANHTLLIARDNTERPIDDSAAPIRGKEGAIRGVVLVFRDVTERRRVERLQKELQSELERQIQERTAEFRASEERFRLLVEGTKDCAIVMLDASGRIESWNPGAESIKGYRADEIIGQSYSRFFTEEDARTGKPQHILELAVAQEEYEEEAWRVRKDGSRFWASVLVTALKDKEGKLRGFAKITRDVTARKNAEEQARRLAEERAARQAAEAAGEIIRQQQQQLKVTLDSIGDAVIATDALGRITLLNPVARRLTGWDGEEAVGQPLPTVFNIKNELTGRPAENPVGRVLREGVVVGLANHTALTARDGTVRPVEDSAAPIKDETGKTLGVVLVFHDVTERRRGEQTARFLAEASAVLAALGDFHRTLQKVARLAVPFFADWCVVDMLETDGSLSRVAMAHADPVRLQWARDRIRRFAPDPQAAQGVWSVLRTGQSYLVPDITESFLSETVRDQELQSITRALGLRSYIAVPIQLRAKVMGVMTFVAAESGRRYAPADLTVAQDLGQRVGIALENTHLYRELQETDRRKDDFLAMLAHELRNPLAPIRNAVHILRQRDVDDDTASRVKEMMERQLQHLARLVDDLLDMSRITRGMIELRREPVAIATIVARAVETAQPEIDAQGHHLHIALASQPLWVDGDPIRLTQVLSNLLTNSAKYMERSGDIWLSAEQQEQEVVLCVRDAGVGIAPELLPHIFDLFVQAERGLGRTKGGLGIGLTLVRRLVEMHGGKICARSEGLGKGSEFIVRLPVLAPGRELSDIQVNANDVETKEPIPRRRVLVVDDHPDAAESLAMLLRISGQEVHIAHDGTSALEIAQSYQLDMIFLDIGMPVMDGYEVARRLRQMSSGRDVFLVALTGWGQEDDRRRSTVAGFDFHLVKPVEPDILTELLAQGKPPRSSSQAGV
jgi:PAS domain S-box-containing protein